LRESTPYHAAVRWQYWNLLLFGFVTGCQPPDDGKVHITYWEKWGGKEAIAMQAVVDQFNQSQDRIVVEFLPVSQVDRKTIVATAGGDPPDIAGLWLYNLYSFADRDALTPLDELAPPDWTNRYSRVYADMTTYRGRIWGAVSAPSVTALHWNKRLFREAGLDPDRPPRTLAELDEFAAKLNRRDARTGELLQVGFLPQEPNWFTWAYPLWFGGSHRQGQEITIGTDPANLAAYRWVDGATRRLGLADVRGFSSGFGTFASPQNAFLAGKVAMVLQGVWMNNFIQQFAPGLDYGVAPWPTAAPGRANFTVVDADVLTIPRGAKHPREAWEFIQYVATPNRQARARADLTGVELLCYLQQKHSPLREWSPFFTEHHPHPYIGIFRQLADSPNAMFIPKIGIWQEYRRELLDAFDSVRLLSATPEESLAFCQQRVAGSWTWHQRSLERRQP
jgi:ABC-type glycerol-3-phosphate transport system substrate-binding protein